jgi:5'(3')-deoxyribonucleotidase
MPYKKKYKIAIDLSDVVEDTWFDKREWIYNKTSRDAGIYSLQKSEILDLYLNNDKSLYDEMKSFVYNPTRIINHPIVSNAYKYILALNKHFEVFIITARGSELENPTKQWLGKYNLTEFVKLILLGHASRENLNLKFTSKIEWCIRNRVNCFVDNDIRHLESEKLKYSMLLVHFTNQKESLSIINKKMTKTVSNWQELYNLIFK